MIYCIEPSEYPKDPIEELSYRDENDFEWKIARIPEGFVVRYFGNEYFKYDAFECVIPSGKTYRIKNTNCILFKDTDFEAFYEMRNILQVGYTDEIWETFEELFTERMMHDTSLLQSEII